MRRASVCLCLILVSIGLTTDLPSGSIAQGRLLSSSSPWFLAKGEVNPSPRYGHVMAYDNIRGRVVLFGGYDGSPRGDMWEWDGTAWVQDTSTTSPPARSRPAAAYDSARGRLVVFGGRWKIPSNGYGTWEWDGNSWVEKTSTPSLWDDNLAMAYDSGRGRVVLFGGYRYPPYPYPGDTWEWDGSTWIQKTPPTSPPARTLHAMAYDSVRGRLVLFGGLDYSTGARRGDTWEWDGTTWINRTPATNPSARSGHAMVYDSARGRVVLFGGYDRLEPSQRHLGVGWHNMDPGDDRH